MKDREFFVSVSDWFFEFEDGKVFQLRAILDEDVSSDFIKRESMINMSDACYDDEFIEYLSAGKKIRTLVRDFGVQNTDQRSHNVVKFFHNPDVLKLRISTASDSVATFNLTMRVPL